MPTTARRHFDDDISRAEAIWSQGEIAEASDAALASDLYRWATAAAVGAMDAYLCDAYVDCLTRALRACRDDPSRTLPPAYRDEVLPVGPLVTRTYTQRVNWSLRMAARARMERDNLLQLGRLKDLFNPVLPPGKKLWLDLIESYIALNRKRLTGISQAEYAAKAGPAKRKAREKAAAAVLRRLGAVVKRQHDIVHNCDRPKVAVQSITKAATKKILDDVRGFITVFVSLITILT